MSVTSMGLIFLEKMPANFSSDTILANESERPSLYTSVGSTHARGMPLSWSISMTCFFTWVNAFEPSVPLSAYYDGKSFKVFMVDVGLLGAMGGLEPESILEGNRIFTEFKGGFTEQYVCQELIASCGLEPFYWSAENSVGEIDFLVQYRGKIYPIEVKAEENLRAKSLAAFSKRYEGMDCRRFSLSGFRDESWVRSVPLYVIGSIGNWA